MSLLKPNPNSQYIANLISMNPLFKSIDKVTELFQLGSEEPTYQHEATAYVISSFASLFFMALSSDENVRKTVSRAKQDGHYDGAIEFNSGTLARDSTVNRDVLGMTMPWNFGRFSRGTQKVMEYWPEINRTQIEASRKDDLHSGDIVTIMNSMTYAMVALHEKTPKPVSLEETVYKDCDSVNSREGTQEFNIKDGNISMNAGSSMTDRRLAEMRLILMVDEGTEWIEKRFKVKNAGGGLQTVLFGGAFESLVNALVQETSDYVFNFRISANSKNIAVLHDYFTPPVKTGELHLKRKGDTEVNGYVGLNNGTYAAMRVKEQYLKELRGYFAEVFETVVGLMSKDQKELVAIRRGQGDNRTLYELLTGNDLAFVIEKAVSKLKDNHAELKEDALRIFDIYYGQMGLYDKLNGPLGLTGQVETFDVDTKRGRGFNRYDGQFGFYISKNHYNN